MVYQIEWLRSMEITCHQLWHACMLSAGSTPRSGVHHPTTPTPRAILCLLFFLLFFGGWLAGWLAFDTVLTR